MSGSGSGSANFVFFRDGRGGGSFSAGSGSMRGLTSCDVGGGGSAACSGGSRGGNSSGVVVVSRCLATVAMSLLYSLCPYCRVLLCSHQAETISHNISDSYVPAKYQE